MRKASCRAAAAGSARVPNLPEASNPPIRTRTLPSSARYYQLAPDLANHTSAQYNFSTPNPCHDGHEGISPCDALCDALESKNNTLRADTWLQQNVPLIIESDQYKQGGALFIIWDEGEDSGAFSDGPIGMFLLSPFAKGGGKRAYQTSSEKPRH
jgi:hypothetical protein